MQSTLAQALISADFPLNPFSEYYYSLFLFVFPYSLLHLPGLSTVHGISLQALG